MQSDCFQAIAHSSCQSSELVRLNAFDWHCYPNELPVLRSIQLASPFLIATELLPQCEVCVVVPARNEAEHLESALTALAHQTDLQGQPIDSTRYEVILLLNNCTDASATIARQFAANHPQFVLHVVERILPPEEAYIGRVRQILMDEAYRRLCSLKRDRGIIASTDGDSHVDSTWVAAILHEIDKGADAIGGRIVTDSFSRAALDNSARAYYLRSVGYSHLITELESFIDPIPFDPFPRHHQFFGANFAVTAEFYAKAGGMPPVRTPEDVAFQQALIEAGARFRHSPIVRVTTSARQAGRTPSGLANQLTQWQKMGQNNLPFLVEPLEAIETRLQARHQLRKLWWQLLSGRQPTAAEVFHLADCLAVSSQWLWQQLNQTSSLGRLLRQIEQRQQEEAIWQTRWSLVRIEEAIADLRLRVYQFRQFHQVNYAASRSPQL
jgi:hypothetical protein